MGYLTEWQGKPVVDWTRKSAKIVNAETAYRISAEWAENQGDPDLPWTDVFAAFLECEGIENITTLVAGMWGQYFQPAENAVQVTQAIIGARHRLPQLKNIYLGDIEQEECEISWIQQTDLSSLLLSFPHLECLSIKGGENLSLGNIQHEKLTKLTIEASNVSTVVVQEINRAILPNLEYLRIFTGDSGYGADSTVEDWHPILHHGHEMFPKLSYLGICNSEYSDQVAFEITKEGGLPILKQIKTLDLSEGTLGDEGVISLAYCPAVEQLKKLDIHHHYVSVGNAGMSRLKTFNIELDASDIQEPMDLEEYDRERYVAFGE
jgi:hypothetical protein